MKLISIGKCFSIWSKIFFSFSISLIILFSTNYFEILLIWIMISIYILFYKKWKIFLLLFFSIIGLVLYIKYFSFNIFPFLKLFSLIYFSVIIILTVKIEDIMNLFFIKYIPYSYEFVLIGQIVSSFIPYLKKEIFLIKKILLGRKGKKLSKSNLIKFLISTILYKIGIRKKEITISLILKEYSLNPEKGIWVDKFSLKKYDFIPLIIIVFLILVKINIIKIGY